MSYVTLVDSGLGLSSKLGRGRSAEVYMPTPITTRSTELPYAFVDPSARTATLAAGVDALPVVLPDGEI